MRLFVRPRPSEHAASTHNRELTKLMDEQHRAAFVASVDSHPPWFVE
jgi:hypothetical protein